MGTPCVPIQSHLRIVDLDYVLCNIHMSLNESWAPHASSFRVICVQGGEDSYDPLSCRSFSTKEPLNIGHFCRKWPIKIRDPMSLRHPVLCILMISSVFLPLSSRFVLPHVSDRRGSLHILQIRSMTTLFLRIWFVWFHIHMYTYTCMI